MNAAANTSGRVLDVADLVVGYGGKPVARLRPCS